MEELRAIYDTRVSFYGKAKVETVIFDNIKTMHLYSYETKVASVSCIYNKDNKDKLEKIVYRYLGKYSQTTTRHQKEFFKQHDLTDKEIKELFKNGKLEKEI